MMRLITDTVPGLGICGSRRVAKAFEEGGSPPVHVYLFQQPSQLWGDRVPYYNEGVVGHATELPFVFDTESLLKDESHALARTMSRYWTNFAATGRPGPEGLPEWPVYHADEDTVLSFAEEAGGGIQPWSHDRQEACDYFEELDAEGRSADPIGVVREVQRMFRQREPKVVV